MHVEHVQGGPYHPALLAQCCAVGQLGQGTMFKWLKMVHCLTIPEWITTCAPWGSVAWAVKTVYQDGGSRWRNTGLKASTEVCVLRSNNVNLSSSEIQRNDQDAVHHYYSRTLAWSTESDLNRTLSYIPWSNSLSESRVINTEQFEPSNETPHLPTWSVVTGNEPVAWLFRTRL